jgi:hypothetical protein
MSAQQKLEASRIITDTDCWETTYKAAKNGYVHMSVNGKIIDLHRIAYMMYIGPIPKKLRVLHSCDNKRCHNPEHLFLGTAKTNTQDMMDKGRHNRVCGTQCSTSNLTDSDIRNIRTSYETQHKIAGKYNVSQSHISRIQNKKIWKHVV